MTQAKAFTLLITSSVLIVGLWNGGARYLHDQFYRQCPIGTHTAMHTLDVYDYSPLGSGYKIYGHKIGDVISIEGVCWPDDKPGG